MTAYYERTNPDRLDSIDETTARALDVSTVVESVRDDDERTAYALVALEVARYRALARRAKRESVEVDEATRDLDSIARDLANVSTAIANDDDESDTARLREIALDLSIAADRIDDAKIGRRVAIANRDEALADALSLAAYVGLAVVSIERIAIDDEYEVASALDSIDDEIARRT